MPDLLIELLSEEIPARMQQKASLDLEKLFTDGISELGLTYKSSAAFSTPRRLTLVLENVTSTSLKYTFRRASALMITRTISTQEKTYRD